MQSSGTPMISVEKIGGTSMSAFGDVLRHIMLYDKSRIYGRVYVVSAYSGVTNQLLEHKKTGEPGIYALFSSGADYHAALNNMAASLKKLNASFAFDRYDTFEWYLKLGALSNVNPKYFKGKMPTWNDFVAHPNYDAFWKKMSFEPRLTQVTLPTQTYSPAFRCASSRSACCQPLSASASTKGSVALFSA